MTCPFPKPYIVFYPVVARDETRLPINKSISAIKGKHYDEENSWRGDIVVAKLSGLMQLQAHFSSITDAHMADLGVIKITSIPVSHPPSSRCKVSTHVIRS
jgi:hypothetical protein